MTVSSSHSLDPLSYDLASKISPKSDLGLSESELNEKKKKKVGPWRIFFESPLATLRT